VLDLCKLESALTAAKSFAFGKVRNVYNKNKYMNIENLKIIDFRNEYFKNIVVYYLKIINFVLKG
jgi:hypothetical protein